MKIECKDCYKIICKQCLWVADDEAELQLQQGLLTACPECGWMPGQEIKK